MEKLACVRGAQAARVSRSLAHPIGCYRAAVGFLPFAKRDLAITAVSAGLWVLDRAVRQRGGLAAAVVGVAAGLGAGVTGFLAHEWGHLAGAAVAGGVAHPARGRWSPFLFNFDVENSSRAQFLAMSLGGFAATVLASGAIVKLVPRSALSGRVALAAGVAGVAATVVLELPTFVRVLRGGPLPTGSVYVGSPRA